MAVLVNPTTGALGKRVSRSVTEDGSALLHIKWNRYALNDEAGVKATTATVEQLVTGLEFLVNTTADTGINNGTYYTGQSGADGSIVYADVNADSVQETIDIINGVGAGQPGELVGTEGQGGLGVQAGFSTRWRAGVGDFRPGFVLDATTGLVVAAANAMLGGESEGLAINGDTSGLDTITYSVGLGTGKAQSGGGQVYADHFESDYLSDTSGNRFPFRNAQRQRENQPGLAEFAVALTEIRADMTPTTSRTIKVYDIDNNLLASFPLAGTTIPGITESTPLVGPIGSPLFVECESVGGIDVDGPLTVTGDIRIA
jgi:hypothetical protein